MSALEELLGKENARNFLRRSWPLRPVVFHRKASDLPRPLREPPLNSFEDIAQVYSGVVQIAGGQGEDHLQFTVSSAPPDYLRRIGLTVFFGDDVSAFAPGGPEFLRQLEEDLGTPRGIGAIRVFCSPPGGGLGAHYDQGETFIVQLAGTKQIWVRQDTTWPSMQYAPGKPPEDNHYSEFSRGGFPEAAPRGGVTITMRPGSVLFVPRGTWHRTKAGTASFSASVCVDSPTPIDVLLPQLKAALLEHPLFRRPLYGAWGKRPQGARRHLTTALRALAASVGRLPPELLLDAVGEKDVAGLAFRPASRFQRVPSTRVSVTGRTVRIRTWGGERLVTLSVSPGLKTCARWLAGRRASFTWKELLAAGGRAPPPDVEALLKSLLEYEAVKWLPFPRLDIRA